MGSSTFSGASVSSPNNVYATLADYKEYVPGGILSTSAGDDDMINACLVAASRRIDQETGTWWYELSDTRLFDVPKDLVRGILWLDVPCLSITTFTNGNGSTVSSTLYVTLPANSTPFTSIRLKQSMSFQWLPDGSGNYSQAISIAGTWGECASGSTSVPSDLHMACLEIARALYGHRTGQIAPTEVTKMTPAGVVITMPNGVPPFAYDVIACHRRFYFG
jgi:hypothetical protein